MRKQPFSDLRMRQAVAYGIDRDELNNVLYRGARQSAFGAFAIDSPFYVDSAPRRDSAKAKSLIAAPRPTV